MRDMNWHDVFTQILKVLVGTVRYKYESNETRADDVDLIF
jgi:hypothetical protein